MKFTELQQNVIELLKERGHLKTTEIAKDLNVTKSDLESDLVTLINLEIVGKNDTYGYFYQGNRSYVVFAEILKYYSVENIMSMPMIIEDRLSVYDAIVTLFLENVGSIYVTRNNNLVGVVSRKDLLRAAIGNQDLKKTPINMVMTRMPNIKTVTPDTSVFACAKKIVDSQIDGVPVIKEEDGSTRVVGRVTKTNLTNLFVRMGYNYSVEELL